MTQTLLPKHGKGWRPDPPDVRDHYYGVSLHFHRDSQALRPPLVDLRHTPNMPKVEDQGQLGSCTAFGTLAAVMFVDRMQGFAVRELSHLFQYYNTRKLEHSVENDSGGTIRDAVKAAAKFGVIPETMMKYNVRNFAHEPSAKCYNAALTHQVTEYLRVENDSRLGGATHLEVSLAAGYPVVFGATLYTSFEEPGPDPVTHVIPMPGNEQVLGGHCMLIVGYDRTRRLFLVRNSWGTSYGDKGYIWIPYNYLLNTDLACDFWTLRKVENA
jgi:C1A family cysteine protease